MQPLNYFALALLILALFQGRTTLAFKTRATIFSPKKSSEDAPKLVIIGGCTGTGKSTFGMSVALDQGILKCVSTDTVRAVMRSFIPTNISPPLHRSSYAPANDHDDPVESWIETCAVLEASVEELVSDSIRRRQGLVLEGVSIRPGRKLMELWEAGGGVATGCLLTVSKADTHKALLKRRGDFAGEGSAQKVKDEQKIASFDRIRKIQDEMVRLARESNWILMEQKLDPDPLEIIASHLDEDGGAGFKTPDGYEMVVNTGTELVPKEGFVEKGKKNDTIDSIANVSK